jgi:hypothetical protein
VDDPENSDVSQKNNESESSEEPMFNDLIHFKAPPTSSDILDDLPPPPDNLISFRWFP